MNAKPTFTEHLVPREQGKVYARDYAGTDPAFVLMHGFPDNLHIYDDLIPHLVAAGRRVVTFDFQGFGRSDKPDGATYSFKQQLGDLEAVVDHLGLGKIVPVMHDASGAAGMNFAIDHPESTESLVILNAAFAHSPTVKWPELIELFATANLKALSSAIIQSPEQFGWIVNFQRESFKKSLADKHKARYDEFLGPVIDGNFRNTPGAGPAFVQMTAQFFEELTRNTARLPMMEALDTPAKIIWGENDPYINAGGANDFQSHLKHASLRLIPAGHWLQIDEPALVAKEMLS
ncbi:alpha/beta hydrolase [Variovorax paradoxus]|nr:alpha/beta hydrolase [Variovorax paradoxus]MBT2302421.1 alpha/beta hydrolase [Variovorax paradoxus]